MSGCRTDEKKTVFDLFKILNTVTLIFSKIIVNSGNCIFRLFFESDNTVFYFYDIHPTLTLCQNGRTRWTDR